MLGFIAAIALLSLQTDLSAEQAREDLALTKQALERLHPGYTRFVEEAELNIQWERLDAALSDGADLNELYLGLSSVLADIRCDHTKAELPKSIEEAWEIEPVYLPFRFVIFNNRMYVDAAHTQTGLKRGEEILSIDGDSVVERLQAVRRFIPVDGFTDRVKDTELEQSGEFLGSGFDHFDALLNPDDGHVTLSVRALDGTVREVFANRVGFEAFRKLKGEARRRNFSDDDAVTIRYPSDEIAVLSVETFVNYRTPIDPMGVFSPLFSDLKHKGVKTLIVDMRRNGGGSTDAMQALLAHLTRKPINQHVREIWVTSYDFEGLQDHIQTWDPAALDPDPAFFTRRDDGRYQVSAAANDQLSPFARAQNAFDGDVIILTSRRNTSGVTQMIAALYGQDHIRLVGEPTGGSQEGPTAGIIWFLKLPNSDITVRIPWLFQRSDIDNPVIGYGFEPDILASETYQSWFENKDVALDAALKQAEG